MARRYQKYAPEFREEMATLVVEGQRANCSLAGDLDVVLSDQRRAVGDHPAGLHTGKEQCLWAGLQGAVGQLRQAVASFASAYDTHRRIQRQGVAPNDLPARQCSRRTDGRVMS